MSLRSICRDMVLQVVLKRAVQSSDDGDSCGRLQLVVDEQMLPVLNSFLKMGDLHAEGVTSMELLSREREALPGLDALYLMAPSDGNFDKLLEDFKSETNPQHRHIFLVLSEPVSLDFMSRLAESKTLAARMRGLQEVPLSAVLLQDRGFHLNMLDAFQGMFPIIDPAVARKISHGIADVCRCLQAAQPNIRYAQGSQICRQVAEQVQAELSVSERGPGEGQVPLQLLILDRSVDIAAVLVHEYTYEAVAYDLLDGDILDIHRNIVKMRGPPARELMLGDSDDFWQRLRYKHVEDVRASLDAEIERLRANAAREASGGNDISTAELLDKLRRSPQDRDNMERLDLHTTMLSSVFRQFEEQSITTVLGLLEQDIACGVDQAGKDVKDNALQNALRRAFTDPAVTLSSETRLRLLMLYFSCIANISETVRTKLIEMARLEPEEQAVLMSMLRSKLMEIPDTQRHKLGSGTVHRVTKEQAARFKRNALSDQRYTLSRFEPRLKEILEQLQKGALKEADYTTLDSGSSSTGGLRAAGAGGGGAGPLPTFGTPTDEWGFGNWPTGDNKKANGTAGAGEGAAVTARYVVFVVGGITHSELRAAAEVLEASPKGTEILLGGTSLLTPRRLLTALGGRGSHQAAAAQGAHPTVVGSGVDAVDLT